MSVPPDKLEKPGVDAGKISAHTQEVRGPMPLTADQRRRAKSMRLKAFDFPMIAAILGRSETDVRHGLATVRTRRDDPTRATLNVSPAAKEQLDKLRHPGEAIWETFNRVIGI